MEKQGKTKQSNPVFWIAFAAFLFSYFWFYIRMVFFHPSRVMQVLEPVRRLDPIGYDLMRMVGHATAWVNHTISPYAELNNFPPVATLTFVPFTWVPLPTAYMVMTILTLVCFFWVAFLFPYLLPSPRKVYPILVLIFVVTLTSYGLQFELERGQFYTLSIALAFAGIYLFHKVPRLSWLAYLLFSFSIQLKIFPFVFVFMFIRDWRDWKNNLLRFAGLFAFNIALLFILGWGTFVEFFNILTGMAADPFVWIGNMSARSFSRLAFPTILERLSISTGWVKNGGSSLVEFVLTLLIVILFALTIWRVYKRNRPGIDPYLLFVCTCANLLLPPISHDYKLPTLAGSTAILLIALQEIQLGLRWRRIFIITLTAIFSLMYFFTQYSTIVKSPLIANNFPVILTMMAGGVTLFFLDKNPGQMDKGEAATSKLTQT